MNRIYLNESSKKYYTDCLHKEIELRNIDPEIAEYLLSICQSKSIRPIFSKKGENSIKKRELHSFLRIAFTKDVIAKLLNETIPHFETLFSSHHVYEFNCKEIKPYVRESRTQTEHNKGSKWLIDPEYFNISQIIFDLKKGDLELHSKFWDELNIKLSII